MVQPFCRARFFLLLLGLGGLLWGAPVSRAIQLQVDWTAETQGPLGSFCVRGSLGTFEVSAFPATLPLPASIPAEIVCGEVGPFLPANWTLFPPNASQAPLFHFDSPTSGLMVAHPLDVDGNDDYYWNVVQIGLDSYTWVVLEAPGVAQIFSGSVFFGAVSSGPVEFLVYEAGLITIDIEPGDDSNLVRPGKGRLSVALLGSAGFDVTSVVVTSLVFGPAGAGPMHDLTRARVFDKHLGDLNGDGITDLLLHFRTALTGIQSGDPEACLDGETTAAHLFHACDSLQTAP